MRLAAGLAYAAFGATFASHTVGALVAVLVPAVAALGATVVVRRHTTDVRTPLDRSHLPWVVWVLAFGVWELAALFAQDLTISLMMDPVLEIYPLRVAGWVLWLWAGWLLVRR